MSIYGLEYPSFFETFKEFGFSADMQILWPHWQLIIIIGLCLDGGNSLFSRFLNLQPLQFAGRISMAMYLIHDPVAKWIVYFAYGSFPHGKPGYVKFPPTAIPFHISTSIILASLITLFFEEPLKRKLSGLMKSKVEERQIVYEPNDTTTERVQ